MAKPTDLVLEFSKTHREVEHVWSLLDIPFEFVDRIQALLNELDPDDLRLCISRCHQKKFSIRDQPVEPTVEASLRMLLANPLPTTLPEELLAGSSGKSAGRRAQLFLNFHQRVKLENAKISIYSADETASMIQQVCSQRVRQILTDTPSLGNFQLVTSFTSTNNVISALEKAWSTEFYERQYSTLTLLWQDCVVPPESPQAFQQRCTRHLEVLALCQRDFATNPLYEHSKPTIVPKRSGSTMCLLLALKTSQ